MNFNKFFVKNYQFTLVIFLALVILGINSLLNMPRAEDPPFGAPIFSVVIIYPGTNPSDMEQLVADPIEEELYKLNDIKKITSTIQDGLVVMLVEFNFGVNIENKNNDVIREINKIRPDLPDGIVRLDIKKAASSDVAILQTAIMSDTESFQSLNDRAETLKKNIERIKEVKWVEIQAVPENKVHIQLDLDKMSHLKIGLNQVLGLIQANNINIPGGNVDIGKRKYNIVTTSTLESLSDIENTIVKTNSDGRITKLKDIAFVYETDSEVDHIARMNGKRSIWMITAMKDHKNIIQTRSKIEEIMSKFKADLPKSITLTQAFDQEVGVKSRLSGLGRDFAIAIGLVLLTLLPLGTRASLVVMVSIPLSLCIGLFMLDMLGYTLNQLSIVGMVIALGLLVDDSIVVVENIERYMRKGITAYEAAISATNHIMAAILGCTATLLLAFLPLANLPEGSGDFIRSLPMAVMVTVLASLFVSVTIIPFLSSKLLAAHEKDTQGEGNFFYNVFKKYVNTPYQRFLTWCIQHPIKTLVSAALLFALSFLIVPLLGFSLFPASEKPILIVDVETEPGSNLDNTDVIMRKLERSMMQLPQIKRLATNVGKGNPKIYYNEFQRQNSTNVGQFIVFMDDHAEVSEIQAFADSLRNKFSSYPGAKIEVKRYQQGPPITAPIEFRVLGTNLDSLEDLGKRVEKLMKATPGTLYVRNDLKYESSDIVVDIDKDKAGLYGITGAEVSKTIRMAIAGLDIGEISDAEGENKSITVSLQNYTKEAIDIFDKIFITSLSGSLVPLNTIATISLQPSPPVIRHFNKERYALLSSFVANGYNTSKLTDQLIEKIGNEIKLPAGYTLMAAGERESAQESFGGIGTIILLTVFGLLAILILEFRTFKSTLIVLSVIPMGIIGAFAALWLTGETLSFVATVGIIALAGIEIKNSILMVDYTNSLREKGMPLYEAVMDGAETRFLPILLTSMTAIGGLTPIALERSPLISPLAIVLIGGLISSTLLSRLVTPVLYYLIPPKI